MLQVTAECKRVLKPTGSILINLGDKYQANPQGPDRSSATITGALHHRPPARAVRSGVPDKSLMLLPERYRIACVDTLGLTARAVIVWHKANPLPDSARDRVRRTHEDWVHLTKSPQYYSAIDELREPYMPRSVEPGAGGNRSMRNRDHMPGRDGGNYTPGWAPSPLGKPPGSVWRVASEPLRPPAHLGVDHHAAFPAELPRRIILGWSPSAICLECGEGRRPVVDQSYRQLQTANGAGKLDRNQDNRFTDADRPHGRAASAATIRGYACACTPSTWHPASGSTRRRGYSLGLRDNNAQGTYGRHQAGEYQHVGPWREYHLGGWAPPPTRPSVVLDPFAGTGTTVMVARALGRFGIGIDLSGDYLRLAAWRVWESGGAARAVARTNHDRQTALDLEGMAG